MFFIEMNKPLCPTIASFIFSDNDLISVLFLNVSVLRNSSVSWKFTCQKIAVLIIEIAIQGANQDKT
ncbi:Uncharacterised protein [Klebsiella pneumoniae]|uniref:Uncharacterized protein n=1 Tax=Klebsiella pneumoniae TaxID=573 RepID=A0A2X3BVJ7_KLEPN|nr:Uncharacterised protein [Klebsiella pneumoniae]